MYSEITVLMDDNVLTLNEKVKGEQSILWSHSLNNRSSM